MALKAIVPLALMLSACRAPTPPVVTGPNGSARAAAERDAAVACEAQGNCDCAARRFYAAYNWKPDAELLPRIASSYEKCGNLGEAVHFYERYLSTNPAEPWDARGKVTELRARMKKADCAEERKAGFVCGK